MQQALEIIQGGLKKMTHTKESGSSSDICPVCGEKTIMEIEALGRKRTVKKTCSCQRKELEKQKEIDRNKEMQHRLERLRGHSLMDARFYECSFEKFEIDSQNKKMHKLGMNYCDRWQEMKEKNVGLLFHGEPGTGKTYLSFCIANKLLEQCVPVIAISSIGIINRIYESYGQYGSEGEAQIINSLKNASLLIIDDLGAEYNTPKARQLLYSIIDSRYRDKKPMIVTTNLSLEQLKEKLRGDDEIDRTYDRLLEMCTPVQVIGKSRRADYGRQKTNILKSLLE